MIGLMGALSIGSVVTSAFQGYNQARLEQIRLGMQADTARYQAGVSDLNRTMAANDIYSIGKQSDIARSQYGQQAAQVIASTRASAAKRGVVGSTGSAAAQTAGAKYAAQRDLYSMSMTTLSQINDKKMEVSKYQTQANYQRAVATAYDRAADDINPWAQAVAAGVTSFMGEVKAGNMDTFLNEASELINFGNNAQPSMNFGWREENRYGKPSFAGFPSATLFGIGFN